MRAYDKLAAALLLLPDEPLGWVRVESSGRLRIESELTAEQRTRFREAVKATARLYLAAGAKEVYVLDKVDGLTFAPTTAPFISAHQQGAVRFAASAQDGGAAPDGQVYGTRGVYVFDSSGFPSSASSHTMAPIITVSRMLSQRLLTTL